jgi:hypothetical protein
MVMSRMEPIAHLRAGEAVVTTVKPPGTEPKVRARAVSVYYGE